MTSSSHPKIGIRPTIDGRLGGVRESLEVQTMKMAQAAADLISSSLFLPGRLGRGMRAFRHMHRRGPGKRRLARTSLLAKTLRYP